MDYTLVHKFEERIYCEERIKENRAKTFVILFMILFLNFMIYKLNFKIIHFYKP